MKIAIVGAGVSGLTAAYYLHKQHETTLFEANPYAGGHTDTHTIRIGRQVLAVDSGFIVFNEHNYPNFTRMLRELQVDWQDSDMSFSAVNEKTGMEYGADGLERLLAQRRNIVNPSFYRMLWDLFRFYREAPAVLSSAESNQSLGEYLAAHKYGQAFIENHIVPMACALWSASAETIEALPIGYFVAFMNNHRMLQVNGRPQWKVVKGGSNQYVKRILAQLGDRIRVNMPVRSVTREAGRAVVATDQFGKEEFDAVVFACHSDQALRLLNDPSPAEKQVLGAIPYQENHITLHSDPAMMPRHRQAWASWNARIPKNSTARCSVSYWMNNLQNLDTDTPLIVSLNGQGQIDPEKIWAERVYQHPVYTKETIAAQHARGSINGVNNSYFCGAYWGWGFHEDGVKSALDCVQLIENGVRHAAA